MATLIGHWKFDESGNTSTAADSSGNGYNGTLQGFDADPSASWVTGQFGNGLQFNGTDEYVSVGDIPNSSTMSWSFWMKTGGAIGTYGLIDKYATTTTAREYRIYANTVNITLQISSDGNNSGTQSTTDLNLAINSAWMHVVLIYNAGTFTAYKNNSPLTVDGNFTLTSIYNSTTGLQFGRRQTSSYFNGALDNIHIFDGVLTTQEISALYTSGTLASPSGAIRRYYQMV